MKNKTYEMAILCMTAYNRVVLTDVNTSQGGPKLQSSTDNLETQVTSSTHATELGQNTDS